MSGFYTGSANSFADVKTAIESALTAKGWSSASGIFNKGGIYTLLTAATNTLDLAAGTGQSGASLTGAAPGAVRIASFTVADPISWPVTYDIHISEDPLEVYAVIRYNGTRVQVLAFGVSPAPGNSTGLWLNGSGGTSSNFASASTGYTWVSNAGSPLNGGGIAPVSGYNNMATNIAAGVLASYNWASTNQYSYYYHNGSAWRPQTGSPFVSNGGASGGAYALSLLESLPSVANQGMVLVPAYLFEYQTGNRTIPMLQLGHLRHCRVDNYEIGDVVEFGPDKWMVYPIARKNAAVRSPGASGGAGLVNHTGTHGFAVRYHGP